MIALNESHGYKRTGNAFGIANNIIEWEKSCNTAYKPKENIPNLTEEEFYG